MVHAYGDVAPTLGPGNHNSCQSVRLDLDLGYSLQIC